MFQTGTLSAFEKKRTLDQATLMNQWDRMKGRQLLSCLVFQCFCFLVVCLTGIPNGYISWKDPTQNRTDLLCPCSDIFCSDPSDVGNKRCRCHARPHVGYSPRWNGQYLPGIPKSERWCSSGFPKYRSPPKCTDSWSSKRISKPNTWKYMFISKLSKDRFFRKQADKTWKHQLFI